MNLTPGAGLKIDEFIRCDVVQNCEFACETCCVIQIYWRNREAGGAHIALGRGIFDPWLMFFVVVSTL